MPPMRNSGEMNRPEKKKRKYTLQKGEILSRISVGRDETDRAGRVMSIVFDGEDPLTQQHV